MICWLNTSGNDVQHTTQDLYLQYGINLTKNTGSHGFYISEDHFRKSISFYTMKTLIKSNWINTNNLYIGRNK